MNLWPTIAWLILIEIILGLVLLTIIVCMGYGTIRVSDVIEYLIEESETMTLTEALDRAYNPFR